MQLFTWMDVELVLERGKATGKWPAQMRSANAYHDLVEVFVEPGTDPMVVNDFFAQLFGMRFEPSVGLFLEAAKGDRRVLPIVQTEETSNRQKLIGFRPSFRGLVTLLNAASITNWPQPFTLPGPEIIAFYSFKGGVGRTLSTLAAAAAIHQRAPRKRILLVDADVEAPGLTWLAHAVDGLTPPISFIDVLALVLGADKSTLPNVCRLAAERIASAPIRSDAFRDFECFLLPAVRDEEQLLRVDVRPEHISRAPGREWLLPEALRSIGSALGVDAILIDLRAGFSELAAPILLDPRVGKTIVTTLGAQSLQGTLLTLQQLRKLTPTSGNREFSAPTVLINSVPNELLKSDVLFHAIQKLFEAWPGETEIANPLSVIPAIGVATFDSELLVLNNIEDALRRMRGTDLLDSVGEILENVLSDNETPAGAVTTTDAEKRTALKKLEDVAQTFEFAESGRGESFLVTKPLRNLAVRYSIETPKAVVIGAKGAGKTYTYLQLARSQEWDSFLRQTSETPTSTDRVLIWPFLQPRNLEPEAVEILGRCQVNARVALGISSEVMNASRLREAVDRLITSSEAGALTSSWWRKQWCGLLAKVFGLSLSDFKDPAVQIHDWLAEKELRLVAIVDGLEELFPHVSTDQRQQVAVSALLDDVLQVFREINDCRVGIVNFVRADIVKAAIPQNTGQFERLHEPFRLNWDRDQALRLVYWLWARADTNIDSNDVEKIPSDKVIEALYPLWGRKLGLDHSREAHTAEYVIAALSDYQGHIQARDVVRMLRHAAKRPFDHLWADRLLSPIAIRNAVNPCSQEKIRETEQEIKALKPIFEKLRTSDSKYLPFRLPAFKLEEAEVRLLEDNGVLFADDGDYFIPEIYRVGLGFNYAAGARPRVLSLAKRAGKVRRN